MATQRINFRQCRVEGCENYTHSRNSASCKQHLKRRENNCLLATCRKEFIRSHRNQRYCEDHKPAGRASRGCRHEGCTASLPYGAKKYCASHQNRFLRGEVAKRQDDDFGEVVAGRVLSEAEQKQASQAAIEAYLAQGGKITHCGVAINA